MADEIELRRELAAAYRLVALNDWDDHVATHISVRLDDGSFLINPFGLLFEEITASSLVRVAMDGTVLSNGPWPVNPAAFCIHAGVYGARAEARAVVHLHTRDGAAVSALAEGLLPLNQTALMIRHEIAYHDFEGVATRLDEQERLGEDLGSHNLMILRNHGTLALGRSLGAAMMRINALEWACTTQVRTLGMGRELVLPSSEAQARVAAGVGWDGMQDFADTVFWPAMVRRVERRSPGFEE